MDLATIFFDSSNKFIYHKQITYPKMTSSVLSQKFLNTDQCPVWTQFVAFKFFTSINDVLQQTNYTNNKKTSNIKQNKKMSKEKFCFILNSESSLKSVIVEIFTCRSKIWRQFKETERKKNPEMRMKKVEGTYQIFNLNIPFGSG